MYRPWKTIDIKLMKIGILPQNRSVRACRVFCMRNGIDFPGKKAIDENNELIERLDEKYSQPTKGIEMKKENKKNNDDFGELRHIYMTDIVENDENPRSEIGSVEDLKASIKTHGLMQPIVVRRIEGGAFKVIAGSRRFKACKELKMGAVPCIIVDTDDKTAFQLATAENVVRENMSAVDEANAVAKLFAQGKSRTEIGAMFGKSARWAEGRRKIVELGDKAMEYLAAGKINLGHAEVLTMCNPNDVEKWLGTAIWKSPEELKNAIMNERPLLERAPFNAKKVCAKCENRSDKQTDLFGDVQCCYCLDRECFNKHVEKAADNIRKQYITDGFEEVPEDVRVEAEYEYCGWIDAETDDEFKKEIIEKMKVEGIKPMFWVNKKSCEHGLVYHTNDYDDDQEENEVDDGSWGYQLRQMSHERKQKVKAEASNNEKAILATKFKELFGNMRMDVKAMILELLGCSYSSTDENGEENEETYLKHTEYADDNFIEEILNDKVSDWSGINDDIREFFGMDSRETFEREANEVLGEDWDPKDPMQNNYEPNEEE